MRPLRVLRRGFPGAPALDTAASRALLERVAAGALPESLRLYGPEDVVAFSPLDATRPGFAAARAAAHEAGFGAVRRLAGGAAAVFTTETLAFAWCIPDAEPRTGIRARFEAMAEITAAALRRLGVDARIGAVPGEYCPGEHSVSARGRRKLMGVGQRIVRGAAHVGGVIVVGASSRVASALIPVYAALGLPFDPATVGSIEDELGPVPREAVVEALLAEIAARHALAEADFDRATLSLAEARAPEHAL
jgi:octanoyl-[GcvH]:protein N-octanoyltransferase